VVSDFRPERCAAPCYINAESCHGFVASSLRNLAGVINKFFFVTELAEIEDMADIIPVRYDAHLEKQTHTHT